MLFLLPLLTLAATPQQVPPQPATLCDLKNARASRVHPLRPRLVSITAVAIYDFEHGYYLTDPACRDRLSGTGLLRIEFPDERPIDDYPELLKVSSQDFLGANIGKHVFCTCIGTISYADGWPRFTLSRAERVWAAD